MNIVDCYTHNIPRTYLKRLREVRDVKIQKIREDSEKMCSAKPQMYDPETRVADLDKYKMAAQVTGNYEGIDPNQLPVDPEKQLDLCRTINDDMAKMMQDSHGRIYTLGNVPLSALSVGGLDEMKRAIKDLGLKGFMVITNARGTPIDRFPSFWQKAAKLSAPVFIHPCNPASTTCRTYEDEYDLVHVFGWPFESTLIISRLVFSGIIKKNPALRIVTHHAGGMIPFFAGRMNESYHGTPPADQARGTKGIYNYRKGKRARTKSKEIERRPIIEDFGEQLYFDTAIGGNKAAIRCAYEIFGASRIVFGTDYPFGPNGGRGRLEAYPGVVRELGFKSAELDQIFEGNISNLLNLS
ncbi:MAG: amidohydrolase family protein [Nitrososphaerales archaeon]